MDKGRNVCHADEEALLNCASSDPMATISGVSHHPIKCCERRSRYDNEEDEGRWSTCPAGRVAVVGAAETLFRRHTVGRLGSAVVDVGSDAG